MKAKILLEAAFESQIHKGSSFQKVIESIYCGEIQTNKKYIQCFDKITFFGIEPDAIVTLKSGEDCYLYKID